jgi:hypothetical protein
MFSGWTHFFLSSPAERFPTIAWALSVTVMACKKASSDTCVDWLSLCDRGRNSDHPLVSDNDGIEQDDARHWLLHWSFTHSVVG